MTKKGTLPYVSFRFDFLKAMSKQTQKTQTWDNMFAPVNPELCFKKKMHLGDFLNSASSKPDRTKTLEGDGEQPCHKTPKHLLICSLIFKESTLAE